MYSIVKSKSKRKAYYELVYQLEEPLDVIAVMSQRRDDLGSGSKGRGRGGDCQAGEKVRARVGPG